ARRARALLRPSRRRRRSGRCHRRAREELARPLVLPMRYALALAALLAGCATTPGPAPTPAPEPDLPPVQIPEAVPAPVPGPAPAPAARTENVAIAGLMDTARADAAAGRLANAAATLERALRIEPRNPRLWHELARVRLRQGDNAQAAQLAARSNSFAGSDSQLRAANQAIIEQAGARP